MELLSVEKWNLNKIDERTKGLIERICQIYPYPDVNIVRSDDENTIEETAALDLCAQIAIKEQDLICIKRRRVFRTADNKKGYLILSSKMYPQGDKEKFWFGYRKNRFSDIEHCSEQSIVLGCRNDTVTVIKFPRSFIESYLNRMNTSIDDNGNIRHYHIVLFKNPEGKMTMLLSKLDLAEIDVSDYIVGEIS